MAYLHNERIAQCLKDIKKYEQWGKLLDVQSLVYLFKSNSPFSALTIYNGLQYIKAKMKLNVLYDSTHSDDEKELRLFQIDSDIHKAEEIVKHDLEYRGLLIP